MKNKKNRDASKFKKLYLDSGALIYLSADMSSNYSGSIVNPNSGVFFHGDTSHWTLIRQPPVYNNHFSPLPQVVLLNRLDCSLIRPKIKLVKDFMPVLVTSNFDDDSIKNKQASMETAFSRCKYMGNFLDVQGKLTL